MILLRDDIKAALIAGEIIVSGMPAITPETHPNSKIYKAFEAWCDQFVQPSSLDVALGKNFWFEDPRAGKGFGDNTQRVAVDYDSLPAEKQFHLLKDADTVALGPGGYCLGHTEAFIGLSGNIAAQVVTRSTAGRWGICTVRSAGFVDPGYYSRITLEIHNDSKRMMPLYPGRRYCQLVFYRGNGDGALYSGNYNDGPDTWTPKSMLPKPLKG